MYRNQRKCKAIRRNNDILNRSRNPIKVQVTCDKEKDIKILHDKIGLDVQRPSSPVKRFREKNVANRSCYVTPEHMDFGQYYTSRVPSPVNVADREVSLVASPVEAAVQEGSRFANPVKSTVREGSRVANPVKSAVREGSRVANPVKSAVREGSRVANLVKSAVRERSRVVNPVKPAVRERSRVANPVKASTRDGSRVIQTDQHQSMSKEKYDIPELSRQKESKKVLHGINKMVNTGSQIVGWFGYNRNTGTGTSNDYVDVQTSDPDVEEEIDELFINEDVPVIYERLPTHVLISEVPRVKIIAEKFSKYKRNNLELRRLDEKVVCVEYDIFDQTAGHEVMKPVQRMRAFFSIKPVLDGSDNHDKGSLLRLPPNIKHNFDIHDEDLKKLTETEIEIIDGKIEENKSYLEDLRRILKRKRAIHAKKKKTTLDLRSLYEMANRDGSHLGCDFSDRNLLTTAELQEVKALILQRCASSVNGIRRQKIKRKEQGSPMDVSVLSESFVAELLREDTKLNVYQ